MRGGLIIWNADNTRHLADMIRKAREEGLEEVPFISTKRNRFVTTPTHYFSFQEAERLLYDARAELERNPTPVYPENLEGEEP